MLRIVLVSPSDVAEERNAVARTIHEMSDVFVRDKNVGCELVRWETHVYPQAHPNGPQIPIDKALNVKDCDLLIGIFWKRFGMSIMGASSGTEHEIRTAYDAWTLSGHVRPQIMLFFNRNVDFKALPLDDEDTFAQLANIARLRKFYMNKGVLVGDYDGIHHLVRMFRVHLNEFVKDVCTSEQLSPVLTRSSMALSEGAALMTERPAIPRRIYIGYSHGDEAQVRDLYTALKARDLNPSPDLEDFRQLGDTQIQKAVKEANLVLACLSRRSNDDHNFKSVLGMLETDSTYLKLIRLDKCKIPDWIIPNNRNLRQMGATDLWEPDALQNLLTEIEHIFGEATPQKSFRKEASISIPRVNVDIRDPEKLGPHETFRDPDFGVSALGEKTGKSPAMVIIPVGDFWMGSPMSELNRDHDEGPQRRVNFSQPFAAGLFPVTFMEYELFAEASKLEMPSDEGWGRGYRPVINVTWEDAKAYTEWLSVQTSRSYRLLSEAEWEYACRAGTTTRYSWGNDIGPYHANWAGSGINMTSEVGSYEASPWGLYDMYGNVREWLEDVWHESYEGAPSDGSAWTWPSEVELRVIRGGAWDDGSRILRSACRSHGRPHRGYRCNFIGFRIAMSLP